MGTWLASLVVAHQSRARTRSACHSQSLGCRGKGELLWGGKGCWALIKPYHFIQCPLHDPMFPELPTRPTNKWTKGLWCSVWVLGCCHAAGASWVRASRQQGIQNCNGMATRNRGTKTSWGKVVSCVVMLCLVRSHSLTLDLGHVGHNN